MELSSAIAMEETPDILFKYKNYEETLLIKKYVGNF
jgi:hypothetical protein